MFRLDGKKAVVTGAGSGIGLAIAKALAQQGAAVMALDLDKEAAEKAARAIVGEGGKALAATADVADSASVAAAFEAADRELGGVDLLINNAGIAHVGNLENTSEEDYDKVMRVNLKGMYLAAKEAVPRMIKQGGGAMVNLCSIAALIGVRDRFAYSVSKGGVLAMTKSLAVDYMDKGIRCNCIAPARVHTPFVDGFLSKNYPGKEKEMFEQLSAYQPIGRMGKPEEVAAMAVYLCSDESAFVTGHAFPMDGGVLST